MELILNTLTEQYTADARTDNGGKRHREVVRADGSVVSFYSEHKHKLDEFGIGRRTEFTVLAPPAFDESAVKGPR